MDRYALTGESTCTFLAMHMQALSVRHSAFKIYNQQTNHPLPLPLLAGIITQVNIRTSCKVHVIRQAVD